MPRRIRLYVNGNEFLPGAEFWRSFSTGPNGGLSLSADVFTPDSAPDPSDSPPIGPAGPYSGGGFDTFDVIDGDVVDENGASGSGGPTPRRAPASILGR